MDMKIGDLCWAELKGFPPWPGKIIKALQSEKYRYLHKKKLHHYVYFFGSSNYAWVPAMNIKPNTEEAVNEASKRKSISFQKAFNQFKSEMARASELQALERKYCRQGVIKRCVVKIKRLNVDTVKPEKSNSFVLNEVLSHELCHEETVEPRKKIRKTDNSTVNADNNAVNNANNQSTKCQEIVPKKFGFIGRGELGKEIVINLLKSKCDITIWKETSVEYGLSNENQIADSILGLIVTCDIILCCVHNEDDVRLIFKGNKGVLRSFANYQNKGKGLVLLANVDLKVSAEIATSIQGSGSKYVGMPLLGSKVHVINGEMLILCSGDESLFRDCEEVFTSFKRIKYLGPGIEMAPKLNTIIGLFLNSISKSYKEARSLIQELKLSDQTFNDLLKMVVDENSLDALCCHPLERKFNEEDRIRFFLENLNLNTLLEANFSIARSIMQKKIK